MTMRDRVRWLELRDELNSSGLSRRDVARMGLLAAGGVLLGANGRPARAQSIIPGQEFPPSPRTRPFVQPLAVRTPARPQTLDPPVNPNAHQYYRRFPARRTYAFNTREFQFSAHPDLPPSTRWGYDGQLPGPLVDARYGEPVVIRVTNSLPTVARHRGYGIPQIITHLHNFHSATESDGGPWDWYPTGRSKDYHYTMARAGFSIPQTIPAEFRDASGGDVRETLTTLFFHDHRPDFTAPNVYRGLLGLFRIFDERDTGDETDASGLAWRLPSGRFDLPLVIQDQRYTPQGQLFFDQFNLDGHLGDKYVVNGRIQPFHEVQRRKYRLRVYTPGPARIYQLVLRVDGRNHPFTQISHSGNLLPSPRRNLTRIEMVPANRVDLIVDFGQIPAGATVRLANVLPHYNGRKPERGELLNPDQTDNQIMEFRVVGGAVNDPSRVPSFFRPLPPTNLPVARRREWKFGRGNGQWQINGELFDVEADHAPERLRNPRNAIRANTNEIWLLESGGGWEHPVHIHLEEGQAIAVDGNPVAPANRFRADVYNLYDDAREIEVMMSFRDFPDPDFTAPPVGERGRYVIHCHNTTHEDHAMMQTWNVVR